MANTKDKAPAVVDPAQAQAAIAQARRQLEGGDPDAAAAALRHVATRDEAQPAQLAEAGKLMAEAGSPVDAVARYLEAGRGFLEAGDLPQARQVFASAYELDGKSMDSLFELGKVDVAEGKKHDGLDKFVEVLRKSNLKHLPALYEAGCLYELDGQHNQAILAFKRVVDRDKTHVSALEHLGSLHQVRNQLPDAVGFYTRAAEAANALYHYNDAKRLAEAALAIDGGNANARRLISEAEKAIAAGHRPEPKPHGAAVAAEARSTAPSAAGASASPVSDVTPVTPPSADSPVPPPPPSTLIIGLPPDVALLEQQSHAMAQLAQVQNAVAQTYKQRLALEEEIRKAQAALEALQRHQQSVDDDLSGKRDELAKVVSDKEAEEAALAALGDAIAKSKAELETLASLPALIGEAKAKCASVVDLTTKTTADITGVQAQSAEVRGKAASVDAGVKELQAKLQASRQSADALERQLAELAGSAKAVQGSAEAAASLAAQSKSAVEALAAKQASVMGANSELEAIAKNVQQKRAQAEAAIKRLEALQAQRKTQFDEIVFNLPPLGAAQAPAAQSKPAAAAPPVKASPAQVPSQSTSVDAMIAGGQFAEAAKRAQTEANSKPKPAEYLVDVGLSLRSAGKLDDAAKLFAAARDRDQSNVRARFELGSTLADLGKDDEALAILSPLEGDAKFAVLSHVAIGRCLRHRGDLEAAEARFSKALEIEGHPDEHYHQALYQLADLHESKGDAESLGLALWSYEELQTGNPNYGDVAQRVAKLKAQLAEPGARSEPTPNGAIKQ